MAKKKFDFETYKKVAPVYSKWENENEFEVVVGTKRMVLEDMMDKAAQDILKSARFRLKRDKNKIKDCTCEVVKYKGKKTFCLTDEHYLMLDILNKQMPLFFKEWEFSPQSFAVLARTILRPVSLVEA